MTSGRATAAVVVLLALAPRAQSFPGSARWGYANCVACHYNPAGGGLINSYGRQMSRELLSSGGSEQAALFAFGKVAPPSWLAMGGDFAFLRASTMPDAGRKLEMLQADVEAVATRGRFLFQGTLGLTPEMGRSASAGPITSRRHYLQYQVSPTVSVRAGKFLPNFGVWNGDLQVATKKGGGWQETYNLEANWIRERYDLGLTVIGGGTDVADLESERGIAATSAVFLGHKIRAGLSVAHKENDQTTRDIVATHGVFGCGRHGYLLEEVDVQRQGTQPNGAPATEWMVYSNWCLAYEMVKGLYALAIEEWSRRDIGGDARWVNTYGAGLRWFPRSHLELQARWRRRDPEAISPEYMDGLSAFFHFYP
jgi:hypothetical protein